MPWPPSCQITSPGDWGGLGSSAKRLRSSPGWNPRVALALIVFIMLYVPCFATVVVMRKEAGTGWALFSMAYNLCFAYVGALSVQQSGRLLGWG